MLCILKQDALSRDVLGWIIAADLSDARRQASAAGEQTLAQVLYRAEGALDPTVGKHELPVDPYGNLVYTLLAA
jgi:hypothetical protein